MSDTRLLLDGPDLQALVQEARELGGRVVRAERMRKGLLGRQWYEVTVAVATRPARAVSPVTAAAVRPAARRPAGLPDLLAAAEAAERADAAAGAAARGGHAAATTGGGR